MKSSNLVPRKLKLHLINKLLGRHINRIRKSVANQLNAFIRLKHFSSFQERKAVVNGSLLSNFNYCALVWMFCKFLVSY